MLKSIKLALNNYTPIPETLANTSGSPVETIPVDMAKLYHHYWLDTRGQLPPNPDPAQFEHLSFFCAEEALRLKGDGIGDSLAFRISRSNDLGQAFCRWFLYSHLNITYFSHMHRLLDKGADPTYGVTIKRVAKGDTPDYFCAETRAKVFLAEAKCRREAVSFTNAAFSKWRKQFERVVVVDTNGEPRAIKGHIVATRLAAEADSPRVQSKIYAEDPYSPGRIMLGDENPLGDIIITQHYADIAAKLAQPILASALDGGYTVPDEIRFPAFLWEFRAGPLVGYRFVGGIYARPGSNPEFVREGDGIVVHRVPFRLDQPNATFVGVEEKIFKSLTEVARRGRLAGTNIPQLAEPPFVYSGVSVLRDGSAIGPADFFRAVGPVEF